MRNGDSNRVPSAAEIAKVMILLSESARAVREAEAVGNRMHNKSANDGHLHT